MEENTKITGDFTQAIEAVKESAEVLRQYNEGARIADDFHCPVCSARGFRFRCPDCSREPNTYCYWGD